MTRRILHKFRIDEISGVDLPAQQGAKALIRKRNGDIKMPPEVNTSAEEVESLRKQLRSAQATDAEAEALRKQLRSAQALASLTDTEKVFHAGLAEVEKEAFLKADANGRAASILAARSADPVVYTTVEGLTLRKSAGDVLISMAKSNDALRKQNEALAKASEDAALNKRVSETIPHLPGDELIRASLLKAIESIADKDHREKALGFLKAQDAELAKSFKATGHQSQLSNDNETPVDDLDGLAKAYQAKESCTLAKAYDAVLQTEKGQELYAKSIVQ